MTFTWPIFLLTLLLVPLFVWLLWVGARRRQRTAQVYADPHLLPAVVHTPPRAHRTWPLALQLLALSLLLFASARPVAAPTLPTNKAAVVIALDASRSMLADDLNPSRLEAAKATAREFIKLAPPTTKIGLASFSDNASVLVTPTTDRQELLEALDRVKPSQNTSLTSAVVTGVRMLPGRRNIKLPEELQPFQADPSQTPFQVQPDVPLPANATPEDLPPGSILILSDGVTNVSTNPRLDSRESLNVAVKLAKDNAVKLYTFPMGREGGTVMRIDGQDYFVPFEPKTLEQLAQGTGGKNVFPPSAAALQEVFRELGTVIRWEATRIEVSSLMAALAVLLMLIGGALSLRWQRRVP